MAPASSGAHLRGELGEGLMDSTFSAWALGLNRNFNPDSHASDYSIFYQHHCCRSEKQHGADSG